MPDLNTESFVKELFTLDAKIRWISIVDDKYKILVSKQREGVRSFMPDETERNFFSIFPQIVVDTVEKLSPFLGNMAGTTVHYEKALLVFYRFQNLTVGISFQPEAGTPFYDKVTTVFRSLAETHLT